MLQDYCIFVGEDDFALATELRYAFVRAGATVNYPADTIEDALDVIMSSAAIDGAVLSVNLQGEATFAAAEHLQRRQIPFVFLAGFNASNIPERFRNTARVEKPVDVDRLTGVMEALVSARKPLSHFSY
ncbi:response regulator [Mesorhizobium caraganae]|uniref:response regulator n=1 Tax=Mesorhizobium caraganae TaxID=483206 RepID=UPI0017827174|nr:response regulator [Mesorhizobium caraganae]